MMEDDTKRQRDMEERAATTDPMELVRQLDRQHNEVTDLRTSVLEWAVRWRASLSTQALNELQDIVLGEVNYDLQD